MVKTKNAKRIPKLRFPSYKGNWEESRLGNVCVKIQDGNYGGDYPKSDEFVKEGVPFLTSKAIGKDGVLIEDKIDYISNEKHQLLKKAHLQLNDVLFTNRGANVGAIGFVDKRISHGNIGPQLTLFRCKQEAIIPSYLKQIMTSNFVVKQVRSQDSGSAMNFFGIGATSKFKLVFPTLPEQEKIASFLSAVDKKIAQLSRKKELLEQYKKGVMQKIFSQQIRFTDDNGKGYPDWQEKKLGELCKIRTGKLDVNAMDGNGKYRFYTCAKDFYMIDEYAFDTEALLVSGNGANVGYIHYYKGKFNAYQRTYVLDCFTEVIQFIKRSLEKNLAERINREKNEGNTPYIILSTLSDMTIALPHKVEQQKIASFLTSIDKKIESVQTQLTHTKTFKRGLLQQMFV